MSGHEEKDPFGETQSPEDPLSAFETFRAQREEEQAPAQPVPYPEQYMGEPTAVLPPLDAEATVQFDPGQLNAGQFNQGQFSAPQFDAGQYGAGAGQYNAGPYGTAPYGSAQGAYGPGFATSQPQQEFDDYTTVAPAGQGRWRGKTRSAVVFGTAAVLAVGLGIGVYAATQSSGGKPAAAPGVTTSANPTNPSAGPSKGAKTGKVLTDRLTVTAVGTDSFTGKTANGTAMTVQIAKGTKFGTAARPFTRAQLVPGAVVYVRLRHGANGATIATVIAAGNVHKPSTSATPSADA